MNGKPMLYLDQYGQIFTARTVKELVAQFGHSTARRMFIDDKQGRPWHIGYIVGDRWLTAYVPYRGQA